MSISSHKSGQAIVEFVIALVAALVLFAALLQIASLSVKHNTIMNEARRKAGMHALSGGIGGRAPDYIHEWEAGPDKVNYSADDRMVRGNSAGFAYLAASAAHYRDLQGAIGPNMISSLVGDPDVVLDGLQDGHDSDSVDLVPVIRHLVYRADSIALESEVWLTELGDLY